MEVENLDFFSALKYLANLVGLSINDKSQNISFQSKYKALELSSNFFKETLNNKKNKNVLDYLNKRGLDIDICKKFQLGYAPPIKHDNQLIDYYYLHYHQ